MTASRCAPLLLSAFLAVANAPTVAAQAAGPPRCDQPEHRQFDFWVGDWSVTSASGTPVGSNEITLEEDGCLIHEHWKGAKGGTGQSFNFYDRADGKWHQVWVDNAGNWLNLAGTYGEGRMVLAGQNSGPDGRVQLQRLTFFRNADGTVRQLWESSEDAGKSWKVTFDGMYRRK